MSTPTPPPGAGSQTDELQAFAEWKAYPLPPLDAEGRFDKDWLNREFIAFKAGRRSARAAGATAEQSEPVAYGPVRVVGDLVRNLLTLDQTTPIFSAFHVDFKGERRCRTRPVSVSYERVIDGKWVDSARKDVPYAVIVWAKPEADEQSSSGTSAGQQDPMDLQPEPHPPSRVCDCAGCVAYFGIAAPIVEVARVDLTAEQRRTLTLAAATFEALDIDGSQVIRALLAQTTTGEKK